MTLRTLLFNVLLCAAITSTANAEDKFRVCADPLDPPYSTKNGDGFENKIAELFAKKLGQDLEYTWFPNRIGFIRNTLTATVGDSEDEYKCDVVIGVPAGYDRTLTTNPYYHSTYVLLIAKNRGWNDIESAEQLNDIPLQRQESLRIAMFDRGPGTAWLQKLGLLDQGVPYQTMTGDNENNVAMQINKDLKAGIIDMAVLWGPMAGHVLSQNPKDSFTVIPMSSSPGMKFDFSIAMGVRYGDKARKEMLNRLIDENFDDIQKIIAGYQVPLLPIPKQKIRKDDD
ncbi:quinoprotein dehydrogenase-associated putative ABC transporter substrate-binding protein [Methylotuvimicrobium sp.]|uniref:quinoprotein dehydrogenase-associated putative ABC transporter substrate-binding protein n=1 Tax=Methylotuvimicrobium sp. TaxID=2822413 RepID=UPI003D65764C